VPDTLQQWTEKITHPHEAFFLVRNKDKTQIVNYMRAGMVVQTCKQATQEAETAF
jgi:hypothetical protein